MPPPPTACACASGAPYGTGSSDDLYEDPTLWYYLWRDFSVRAAEGTVTSQ